MVIVITVIVFVLGGLSYFIPNYFFRTSKNLNKIQLNKNKEFFIREMFLYETMKVQNSEKCIDDVYERVTLRKQNIGRVNNNAKQNK